MALRTWATLCTAPRLLPRQARPRGAGCGVLPRSWPLVVPVAMVLVAAVALAGDVPIAVLAAAAPRRPITGGPRGDAHDREPRHTAAGGGRPVSHAAARLLLGLAVFVLVGWGVGELWLSVVGSADLNAVRDVVAQRSAPLTRGGAGGHLGG